MVSPTGASVRSTFAISCALSSERRSFTCLLQARLQRVAVDTPVLEVELVGEIVHLVQRVARHEPECLGLAAPPVLFARPRLGEAGVRCLQRPRVRERLALLLLAEDFPDHAAS